MKGKIDKGGALLITRPRGEAKQYCPFSANDMERCSDYCPHFGEPEHTTTQNYYTGEIESNSTLLRLCHGTVLVFDEFTDERSAT